MSTSGFVDDIAHIGIPDRSYISPQHSDLHAYSLRKKGEEKNIFFLIQLFELSDLVLIGGLGNSG